MISWQWCIRQQATQGCEFQTLLTTCRIRPGTPYLASVAVIYTELVKLVICVAAQGGVCWRTAGDRGMTFREEMVHQAREILGRSFPMLVPAALFVMQQVLFDCKHFMTHDWLTVFWQCHPLSLKDSCDSHLPHGNSLALPFQVFGGEFVRPYGPPKDTGSVCRKLNLVQSCA